jgi:hypothetical protein
MIFNVVYGQTLDVPSAAILGLFEILDRFRQKERHPGQGYRAIDDIYSPAFHATITRTGDLDARHFPWKRLTTRFRVNALLLLLTSTSTGGGARNA